MTELKKQLAEMEEKEKTDATEKAKKALMEKIRGVFAEIRAS